MLNSAPFLWTIDELRSAFDNGPHVLVNGRYEPARPYGFYSLGSRCRLAWDVFLGRADALYFPNQDPPKAY